jgi:hypothetical protein
MHRAGFGLTIGLGALLLFQVQFIAGKTILPWYGGVPAVWSACLLFFQVLLLGGYVAAHGVARLRPARQVGVYAAAVAAALVWLLARPAAWPSPIVPSDAWKPVGDQWPVVRILVLLAVTVGVPYLVLSITSPLLQRWWADLWPARSPYRLYALSNLGSLVGLVGYPFVVERAFAVEGQGWLWAWGFVVYGAVAGWCMVTFLRHDAGHDTPERAEHALAETEGRTLDDVGRTSPAPARSGLPRSGATGSAPSGTILWFLLAAVGSLLLQSTTTWITLDVGAVPLLWMVPLALYLITFIIAFEYPYLYRRTFWTFVVLVSVCAGAIVLVSDVGAGWALVAGLSALTASCMVCHGELGVRVPAAAHLTRFYVVIAAGGASGSVFAALIAPRVFTSVLEYPLSLLAVTVLLLAVARDSRGGPAPRAPRWRRGIGVLLALSGVLLLMVGEEARARRQGVIWRSRNFFGSVHVTEEAAPSGARLRRLIHGTTLHGMQYVDGPLDREPTAYYARTSGVGRVMSARAATTSPAHVGLIGLGAGTLAAYARPDDRYRFYEIDPQVVQLSAGPAPLFTFVARAPGAVSLVEGDARLSLEREPPQRFDVLVVDAFSSDAVPAHLLTAEAFALYRRHLRSGQSLLLVHVSNRFLRLADIVRAGGATAGMASVLVVDEPSAEYARTSDWMVLAAETTVLQPFGDPDGWRRPPGPAWTDRWSSVLDAIRW